MTNSLAAQQGVSRRAQIEAVLCNYPNLDPEETRLLIDWFAKEASALDLGMIASDPALAKPYRRFRADHLDRIRGADLVKAFLFVSVVGSIIALIVWNAL